MNTILIKYKEIPMCKTCGGKMKEWNAFAEEHEHSQCMIDRVVGEMLEKVDEHLNEEEWSI